MTWQEEAAARLRRGNALLFEKKSLLLAPLAAELEGCGRRRTAFWALDLAEEIAGELKARMPEEGRPAAAVAASRAWAAGALRMPAVRPLILACHAAARETDRAKKDPRPEIHPAAGRFSKGSRRGSRPRQAEGVPSRRDTSKTKYFQSYRR